MGIASLAVGPDRSLAALPASTQQASAAYAYNGEGVRIGKSAGGITTSYLQDQVGGLPRVLVETTNGQQSLFVYGQGLAYEVRPNGTARYYHADSLGSTRVVTSNGEAVLRGGKGAGWMRQLETGALQQGGRAQARGGAAGEPPAAGPSTHPL